MRAVLRTRAGLDGRYVVVALGALYVLLAILFPLIGTAETIPLDVVVVASLLTATPGSVLLYGGYRLPRTSIHAALYDRIAGWCLLGMGLMGAILVLNALVSGLANVLYNAMILTALSSCAGFGVGLYDAKARTRAREAEQRSREIARQHDRLESFARMLAHELRNPLAIAEGYHEESRPRDEAASEKVRDAHERIEEMIDILLITVRGSGVGDSDRATVLANAATDVWEDLSVPMESATLDVDTEQTVRGDPAHVRHLLANLFRNSIEYGQAGVTVRVGDLDDGFYVADDGPGIPAGTRDDVVDAGVSTRESGMGVGLTVVVRIAELYGWEWRIADSERGGTRLEFTNVEGASTRVGPRC